MSFARVIEDALEKALMHLATPSTPETLRSAMAHAVFPAGGRVRPSLCMTVSAACGARPGPAHAHVAAAVELLHCASLVHDDLPCFDDAAVRRGLPSVHAEFGESTAVLAGDGLIILAFETVARAGVDPRLVGPLVGIIGRGVGAGCGLVAGQAWEAETSVALTRYHKAKTGALFEAAAAAGAVLGGEAPAAWGSFGLRLGEAYQVADDLRDTLETQESLGKPVGQDIVNGRPNAALTLGVEGAVARLQELLDAAIDTIPSCEAPEHVVSWVRGYGDRLCTHTRSAETSYPSVEAPAAQLTAANA